MKNLKVSNTQFKVQTSTCNMSVFRIDNPVEEEGKAGYIVPKIVFAAFLATDEQTVEYMGQILHREVVVYIVEKFKSITSDSPACLQGFYNLCKNVAESEESRGNEEEEEEDVAAIVELSSYSCDEEEEEEEEEDDDAYYRSVVSAWDCAEVTDLVAPKPTITVDVQRFVNQY